MKKIFKIVQLSDIHCGDLRYSESVAKKLISEVNNQSADLVVITGDITAAGYQDEYELAKKFIGKIRCKNKIIIAGNHDCRNVGYMHFEEIFGARNSESSFLFDGSKNTKEKIVLLACDSSKPDMNEGEIGRDKYNWINKAFLKTNAFKIFVLHHHLISVPGTGRERNIVWDAGDVLETLSNAKVDLVLSGHKHVPYIWKLNGMLLVTSGTAATLRTRGDVGPSYNVLEISEKNIQITIKPVGRKGKTEIFERKMQRSSAKLVSSKTL